MLILGALEKFLSDFCSVIGIPRSHNTQLIFLVLPKPIGIQYLIQSLAPIRSTNSNSTSSLQVVYTLVRLQPAIHPYMTYGSHILDILDCFP